MHTDAKFSREREAKQKGPARLFAWGCTVARQKVCQAHHGFSALALGDGARFESKAAIRRALLACGVPCVEQQAHRKNPRTQ